MTLRERRDNYNLLDVHNAKFEVLKSMPIFCTFLTDDRQRGAGVLVHTVLGSVAIGNIHTVFLFLISHALNNNFQLEF